MRGCWPAHLPLPLLGPAPALVSPVCELTETEHVAACLCDTRGCNGPARPRPRQPKQLRFPETRRQQQQPGAGLKCFSCGSLFNSSSPQCDQVTDLPKNCMKNILNTNTDTPCRSSTPRTTGRWPGAPRGRPACSTPGRSPARRSAPTGSASPPAFSWDRLYCLVRPVSDVWCLMRLHI